MSEETNGQQPAAGQVVGPVVMNIPECRLCAQPHESVELRPYGSGARTPINATHWYMCPVTNEPLPMTLAGPDAPVDERLLGIIAEAAKCGRFIVIVAWEPVPGKPFRYERQQTSFRHRYAELVMHAAVDFHNDAFGAPSKQELPAGKLPGDLKIFQHLTRE